VLPRDATGSSQANSALLIAKMPQIDRVYHLPVQSMRVPQRQDFGAQTKPGSLDRTLAGYWAGGPANMPRYRTDLWHQPSKLQMMSQLPLLFVLQPTRAGASSRSPRRAGLHLVLQSGLERQHTGS
jgi:hypothetical protein